MDREQHVALTCPFDLRRIKWRIGATSGDKSKGIALAYIDARDVMQRLDQVMGCENWQATYPMQGVCNLSLKIEGEWITKANCAGETQVEAEKGQASDAFKRAAVLWGISRYLYYLDNVWVAIEPRGRSHAIKKGVTPELPAFADPTNWLKYYPTMLGQPTE